MALQATSGETGMGHPGKRAWLRVCLGAGEGISKEEKQCVFPFDVEISGNIDFCLFSARVPIGVALWVPCFGFFLTYL